MDRDFSVASLQCSGCHHAVDVQGPSGCDYWCTCKKTLEAIIDSGIGDARVEADAQLAAMRSEFSRRQTSIRT